jgi:hypothetical protein
MFPAVHFAAPTALVCRMRNVCDGVFYRIDAEDA